jgi:hypothetical protein
LCGLTELNLPGDEVLLFTEATSATSGCATGAGVSAGAADGVTGCGGTVGEGAAGEGCGREALTEGGRSVWRCRSAEVRGSGRGAAGCAVLAWGLGGLEGESTGWGSEANTPCAGAVAWLLLRPRPASLRPVEASVTMPQF